jgi:hypothetical protein
MKLLRFMLLLFPFYAFTQPDSLIETSRLEKMIMQPGTFVNIVTDTIGSAEGINAGVVTATDLNSGKQQRSVCFVAGASFTTIVFSSSNTQIDIEDLNAFIMALEKMKVVADTKTPVAIQRYQYVASNLTVLNMENRFGNQSKWDVRIYKRYKYFNAEVPGTGLFIRGKDVGELLTMLKKYQSFLGNNLYR